jgi:hypothetical protein
MTEQDVLVCVKQHEDHVELSELDVCRTCGCQVWVSPTGRQMQNEKNLRLTCFDCVDDLPNAEFAPMTSEQFKELSNYFQTRRKEE